jgi:hypothetical protein
MPHAIAGQGYFQRIRVRVRVGRERVCRGKGKPEPATSMIGSADEIRFLASAIFFYPEGFELLGG